MKYLSNINALADKFQKVAAIADEELPEMFHDSTDTQYHITSIFHADHGISQEMMQWAVNQIKPNGFFLKTIDLPDKFPEINNALYGPKSGDTPIEDAETFPMQRSPERPMSRMTRLPKRKTRLLTIIGMADDSGVKIYTAYGGAAAEREPGDPSLTTDEEKAVAKEFWSTHALSVD